MTSYALDPIVLVDAVLFTDDALNGITIVMGRQSVDEQPRAGYCNVNLLSFGDTGPSVNIDDPIEIRLKNSTGIYKTVFSGFVSDINRSFRNFGQDDFTVTTNLIAVGNLALLNRRAVGFNNMPKELDGERIARIIAEALSENWDEFDPLLAWQDIPNTVIWSDYDTGVGQIEIGEFDIVAYNDGPTNAYNLAAQVANSARGVLHELGNGLLNYDDSTHRQENVQNNGYVDFAENIILANTSSQERLADIANTITIEYGNNQSVSGTDQDSIDNYGELSANISTLLHDQGAAETVRDFYLTTRAEPRRSLNQITIAPFVDTMTAGQLDAAVEVYCGMPVQIDGIPNSIYGGAFLGFVEGWRWEISRVEAFLSMYLTEYALSVLAQNWSQVNASEAWNTVSNTLDWANAQVVA